MKSTVARLICTKMFVLILYKSFSKAISVYISAEANMNISLSVTNEVGILQSDSVFNTQFPPLAAAKKKHRKVSGETYM